MRGKDIQNYTLEVFGRNWALLCNDHSLGFFSFNLSRYFRASELIMILFSSSSESNGGENNLKMID